ncbi:DNA polymerase-3 subunit delta' [Eubacterium ruminantium]|nr:DNA polymerase-3 subunit delta' [Eubacterium ruminantium]
MDFQHIVGHEDIIRHFKASIEMNRVSHAYIICGEADSGRRSLALSFAKTLQCEEGKIDPCNKCRSCVQADSGNHPDIIFVDHEKPQLVSVEDIRNNVVNTIDIKPYSSKYKIYIIEDGEMMNIPAQNALLKSIEEPPQYAIIIILTTTLDRLLPTIISRCITLSTKPVKERDIYDYLVDNFKIDDNKANFCVEYAQGNLGKAIKLATNEDYDRLVKSVINLETNIYKMDAESIAAVITDCEKSFKISMSEYLDLMMVWYRDILMLKVTGKIDKIMFKDQILTIREQSKYLSFNELEEKARAVDRAKIRIAANAKLEDIMKLLIMTLKEI